MSLFLGLHSFGIFIHNDTLSALARPHDIFGDHTVKLKPFLAYFLNNLIFNLSASTTFNFISSSSYFSTYFNTSDFIITYIHAFNLHTFTLILLKGLLFSRSSRVVADKHLLSFRYPCDGPGRGGTHQLSTWDHIFLSIFWTHNALSIFTFHFLWKFQSDIWLLTNPTQTSNFSSDFNLNSSSINGWLRNFLWAQSSSAVQSYSSSLAGFGLLFLLSHFVWALSLMFLFSGRGYWQELIESILWAHFKLNIIPSIQPRALSISQGRTVDSSHFIIGGIKCTWCFFNTRCVSLYK